MKHKISRATGSVERRDQLNHTRIEREQIIDRYLMGKLEPEMATRFEQHFLHCQTCLDQLELAEKLQRGLKRVAATEASEQAASRQIAILAWIARLSRSRQLGVVMTALLVAIGLPAGMVLRQADRHQRELVEASSSLEQARSELAATQQEGQSSREALEARARAADDELAAARQRFDRELERERAGREAAEASLERARAPRTNLPVFKLSPERSAGFEAEPSVRLRLGPSDERVVLQLELYRPAYPAFRATLLRQGRGRIWQGDGLVPNHADNLVLDLPATMLEAADYRMQIEGLPSSGEAVAVAHLSFRVISEPHED